jgi:CheY-like chemotaxis protein
MAANDRLTGIRRVLLTSTGYRGDLRDGEVDRYLTKPVREAALYDCISELVGRGDRLSSSTVEEPSGPGETPSGSGRILVAEDNPVNQFVARQLLETLGYEVEVVDDGAKAVDAVAAGSYAAVLMDCQMPVMDGYEASSTIRSREDGDARIPIIALTAGAMEGDVDRCLAAGMDDHLPKPVRLEELSRTLDTWLSGTGVGADRA